MPDQSALIPKPRSERINPYITRLPRMVWWRRFVRWLVKRLSKFVVRICIRLDTDGLENLPNQGPAIIVGNHLGDADLIIGFAISPSQNVEILAKSELYEIPILGTILDLYGVIWVHRGQPDRKALRAAIQALNIGRIIAIAPEGRESLTGSLEAGTGGAAYLALKAEVPIVPVTITGTENKQVFGNIKRFRRTNVSLTAGLPIRLASTASRRESVKAGTERIMKTLANQLPDSYRGNYS
jgi:1-acyl-sn-glycerol-3-phosphate acyltransferase